MLRENLDIGVRSMLVCDSTQSPSETRYNMQLKEIVIMHSMRKYMSVTHRETSPSARSNEWKSLLRCTVSVLQIQLTV